MTLTMITLLSIILVSFYLPFLQGADAIEVIFTDNLVMQLHL